MKTSTEPATNPGRRNGKNHAPERCPGARAEIGRGFEQRRVEALERRVHRQHEEGQKAVDQAEQHRAIVIEQREWRRDDVQAHEAPY